MSSVLCPTPFTHRNGHPGTWGTVLIVAAHPDDEVLALGGHFGTLHPRILHLTNGAVASAPNADQIANERACEVRRALRLGGIPPEHYFTSTVPDQSAVDNLPKLYQELYAVVRQVQPDCLLTHPYEGGHPDHDAAALICNLVAHTVGGLAIKEFTSYHNATPFSMAAEWRTSHFIEPAGEVTTIALSKHQQERKKCLLATFVSQSEVLERFSTTHESFRPAPEYSFRHPPHKGRLLYESFDWNIDFQSWRERSAQGIESILSLIGRDLVSL